MIQILGQEIQLTISNFRIAYMEHLMQNVANNTDKKYVYSEYGIAFDSAGS